MGKNKKGITIVALVVTIIVLIILSSIIVNVAIGENGFLHRAQVIEEQADVATITERLKVEREKVDVSEQENNVTLDKYLEHIKDKEIITTQDVEETGVEDAVYVTVEDKYVFLVQDKGENVIDIIYQGKPEVVEELGPMILDVDLTSTTTTIKAEVDVLRFPEGEYKYYYKTSKSEEYILTGTNGDTFIYENLEPNTEYFLKIEVVRSDGETDEVELRAKTTGIELASGASIEPSTWINQDVIVTLPVRSDYTTEYQIGDTVNENGQWIEYDEENKLTIPENAKIYYRYTEEQNKGKYGTVTVSNIDKVNPTINADLTSSNITTDSFTVSVEVTDSDSGISKIDWYYKSSTNGTYSKITDIYTKMNGEETGTRTTVTKSKIFEDMEPATYTVYAEIYDVAGNKVTTQTITIKLNELEIELASGATKDPEEWTNQEVTVTLPTNTDYTTKYQVGDTADESGEWITYDENNKPTISENTKVHYKYTSGEEEGPYNTLEVDNIDTDKPIINTDLNATDITTKGFTLNIEVTDSLSGLSKIIWYYKISTDTSYKTIEEIYTQMNGTTAGTTTTIAKSKVLTDLASGTYNVYAEVYDVAGNMQQTEVKDVTLNAIEAPVITTDPAEDTPTNGNVTIIVSTKDGYIAEYKIGENGTWTTYDPNSKPTVSENIKVHARYNDGKNIGPEAEKEITNIDTVAPTISLSAETNTTWAKSGEVTITITDSESGFAAGGNIKYGWSTSNTEPPSSYTEVGTGNTEGEKSRIITAGASGLNGKYYLWVVPVDLKDLAGNEQTVNKISTGTFYFDNTGPDVEFGTNGNSSWSTSASSTITGTDVSGISLVRGRWMLGTTPLTQESDFTGDGGWTINNGELSQANITPEWKNAGDVYLWTYVVDGAGNYTIAHTNAFYIDNVAPTITATPGTVYDYTDRVTISASDNIGVTSYAVTETNTTPTEWMNVTSLDLSSVETKIEYGATWAKVFAHNNMGGTQLFTSDEEVLSSNTRYKFSILGQLENFRDSNGKFEFLLQYPNDSTGYNRWKQTDNPTTVTIADGDGTEVAGGYEAVHIDWDTYYWGGLTKSTASHATYIDGSVGAGEWFYAIGAKAQYNKGVPTSTAINPDSTDTAVELWVRIDTLQIQTKTSVTVKVGNLNENKNYYAWVKDHLGNISSTVFTISNVDKTAPTVTISPDGTSTWVSYFNPIVTATDTSGIAVIRGRWMEGTSATLTQESDFTGAGGCVIENGGTPSINPTQTSSVWVLWVYVRDNVGNSTITKSNPFYIDTVAPTITISPDGTSTWVNSFAPIVTANDVSGIEVIRGRWMEGTSATLTQESDFTGAGGCVIENGTTPTLNPTSTSSVWVLWVYARDNLGFYTITKSNPFYIDTIGPSISVTPGSTAADQVTVLYKINAVDNTSNIAYIDIKRNDASQTWVGRYVAGTNFEEAINTTLNFYSTMNGSIYITAYDALGNSTTILYYMQYHLNFETVWTTTSANTTVTVPLTGTVNVFIDFGDGSGGWYTTENPTHTYASAGSYTMKISGQCTTFTANDSAKAYITKLQKWGCIR